MNRKTSLIIGISLLVIAVCFIGYAVNHPEAAFPWSNRVTFMLYGIYIWLIFKFLLVPILQKTRKLPLNGSLLKAAIYFSLAVIFFIIEISGEKVDIYTIIRGFIVIGGIDVGIEYFSIWMKQKKWLR